MMVSLIEKIKKLFGIDREERRKEELKKIKKEIRKKPKKKRPKKAPKKRKVKRKRKVKVKKPAKAKKPKKVVKKKRKVKRTKKRKKPKKKVKPAPKKVKKKRPLKKVKKPRKPPKKLRIKPKVTPIKPPIRIPPSEKALIKIETVIKDVMTEDVKSVSPEDNVRETLELLSEHDISGAPVLSKEKIVGIIDETDVFKTLGIKSVMDVKKDEVKLSKLEGTLVKDVMNKNPITAKPQTMITDAVEIMNKANVDRLLVVDEKKKLIGIATREDIIRGMSNEFFVKSLEKGKMIIETTVDQLMTLIKERGSESISKLSKELGVKSERLEEWAKMLEEHELIEIEYPTIGSPRLRAKR